MVSMPTLEDLAALWDLPCKSEQARAKSGEGAAVAERQLSGQQESPSTCNWSVQAESLQLHKSSEFRATVERYLSQKRKSPSKQSSPAATSPSPAKRPKQELTATAEAKLRWRDLLQDSDDSDSDESDSPRDTERLVRRFSQEQELSEDSDSEDSDSDSDSCLPSKQALTAKPQVCERRLFSDSDDSDADESDSLHDAVGFLAYF
ncbi:suppressor protein SRP40-like [Penaeus chinensis]|uniref:suppressor protein SRP40-like n=1 Tax=Penaeus chinensis TaxID=139456 RepID=UPI001FB73E40|nr:suppressor protein SRP40-like [Penaeus chinensis]